MSGTRACPEAGSDMSSARMPPSICRRFTAMDHIDGIDAARGRSRFPGNDLQPDQRAPHGQREPHRHPSLRRGPDSFASTGHPCLSRAPARSMRRTRRHCRSTCLRATHVLAGRGQPGPQLDDDVTRGQFGATPIARVEHLGMSTAVAVPVQQERAVGRQVLIAPGT